MKFTTTLIILVSILVSNTITAQEYYVSDPTDRAYNNNYNQYLNRYDRISSNTYFTTTNTFRFVLDTDPSTKSVMVSNVIADKAGVMSPILGAASWKDNGKDLACRSLLEFDFNKLPIEVRQNPSLIQSAELVLYPINVDFEENDKEKPSFFYVRQVIEKWIDSTTKWNNQPITDSLNQASVLIAGENKNFPANIDVTAIVKKMIKKENNGFMLFHNNAFNELLAAGQIFGSPKNKDSGIRPQLIIYFEMTKRELRNLSSDILYSRSLRPYWIGQQYFRNQNPNNFPTNQSGTFQPGNYGHNSTTSTGSGNGQTTTTSTGNLPSTTSPSGGYGHGHSTTGTSTTTTIPVTPIVPGKVKDL